MKSDNTEEAILLGVNGEKQQPNDQVHIWSWTELAKSNGLFYWMSNLPLPHPNFLFCVCLLSAVKADERLHAWKWGGDTPTAAPVLPSQPQAPLLPSSTHSFFFQSWLSGQMKLFQAMAFSLSALYVPAPLLECISSFNEDVLKASFQN